jgi:hypothetical protein
LKLKKALIKTSKKLKETRNKPMGTYVLIFSFEGFAIKFIIFPL